MSRKDLAGKVARGVAYLSGAGAFAALTHRFNAEAATGLATAAGALAAVFGFLPRVIVNAQRAEMARIIDERFDALRTELGEDITTALRHAVELGVHDGALRRSLDRRDGEPPRPRRLHSVPRNREGA
ncbi:hypothetical protein Drose_06590 [Dactylosporangium roseum]|uniref:Holin n=1 Tax=Dactylosporangium roseum TaxID=47989 RepID=A0ABY5Z7A0_9ACTN|nr:hypothetical protein [Dactylosporangium roseum]UWZ37940.1 hypothetical protein Drose_06590 [Dactylosporangium roseum]